MAETVTSFRNRTYPTFKKAADTAKVAAPSNSTTWAGTAAQLNGTAERLAAKVITAGPPPAPAPAPIPTTPDGQTVPPIGGTISAEEQRAIELGRGAAYSLLRTAGFDNDRQLLIPSETQLPDRVELKDMGWGWGKTTLFCHPLADLTGWDTRGFTIMWSGKHEIRVAKSIIGGTGWSQVPPIYWEGLPDPLAILTLENVTFDMKCFRWEPRRGAPMCGFPGVLQGNDVRVTRLANSWANFGPGQVVRLKNFYTEGPGQYAYYPLDAPDTGQKDHPEAYHQHGADILFETFMFDASRPTHPIPPRPQWIADKMAADPAFIDPPERKLRPGMGTGFGLDQYRSNPALDMYGAPKSPPYAKGRTVHRDGIILGHPDTDYYYNIQITMDTDKGFPGDVVFEDTVQQSPRGGPLGEGNGMDMPNNRRLSGRNNLDWFTGQLLGGRINMPALAA